MDAIQDIEETSIEKINMPTLAAMIPVLEERKEAIDKIERKEFKYGERNRHNLDVYYPPAGSALATPNGKLPVLFFIYGGGYNTGSRRLPEPYDMGYRALGSFFAARGFLTVIPDYRLVPEVRFPAASEDIRDALVWVAGHAREVAEGATQAESTRTALDPGYVFMLAHSAGAAHTLVLHLYAPLRASLREKGAETGLNVRGLVLSGSPWFFSVRGEEFVTKGPVKFYFGGAAEQKEREPRALWTQLSEAEAGALPGVMLVQAEREPDWLKAETKHVMESEMRAKKPDVTATYIAEGHNHVSINWGLGTADPRAEKWAVDVVEWIRARI